MKEFEVQELLCAVDSLNVCGQLGLLYTKKMFLPSNSKRLFRFQQLIAQQYFYFVTNSLAQVKLTHVYTSCFSQVLSATAMQLRLCQMDKIPVELIKSMTDKNHSRSMHSKFMYSKYSISGPVESKTFVKDQRLMAVRGVAVVKR